MQMSPSNMRPSRFPYWNCLQFQREGKATPVNMFSSTLPIPFLGWEGEAPAEPLRRKLGRSLALPFFPMKAFNLSNDSMRRVIRRDHQVSDHARDRDIQPNGECNLGDAAMSFNLVRYGK